MNVHDYIRSEMEKPFVWGKTDCCKMADRWIEINTGISPLSIYEREYSSEIDAKTWLEDAGNIIIAVSRVMRKTNFKKAQNPIEGDAGVISIFGNMAASAIFDGEIWYCRNEQGLIGIHKDKARVLRAWHICPV